MSDQTHAAVLTDSVTSQLLCAAVVTLYVQAIIEEAIDTAVLTSRCGRNVLLPCCALISNHAHNQYTLQQPCC